MQYAALYIEGEYVEQLDWVELGDGFPCFTFISNKMKLNSPTKTIIKVWLIKISIVLI